MFLRCPKCGFSFGLFTDETDEEILKELMTCPCGCMMEETDSLLAVNAPLPKGGCKNVG